MRTQRDKLGSGVEPVRRDDRLAGALVLATVVGLALAALVLLLGSFASYEAIDRRLDAFASDGDAAFSRDAFEAIVLRLRLAAALAGLAALLLYARRARARRTVARLVTSARVALSSLGGGLRTALTVESRLELAVLGSLALLALLLRLEYLTQPMRYDESTTYVHYASQPWYIALTTYTAPNNHVFHSVLVHLSTAVLGGEPWAIRLPALVAGVLLVPATYVAARALYGRDAALVAAGLVAGSSVLVEYSTNARGYTLAALVFVLLLALATRLPTTASAAEWLAFAALGAVGFFTVPVMLYGYGTIVVWLALGHVREGRRHLLARRLAPAVLATIVFTGLLYLPIVAASGLGALVDNEFVTSLDWQEFWSRLPDSIWATLEGWHRDVPLPVTVLLVVGFLTALVAYPRSGVPGPPVAVVAAGWSLAALLAQRVVPFERVWLILLPLYLITSAAGLVFLVRLVGARARPLAPVLAGLLAAVLAVSVIASDSVRESEDTSTFRDAKPVAALLARELDGDDKVLVAPPADAILEYELLRRGEDAGALLYWSSPGSTTRLLAVVKETPDDYPLSYLLADPRLTEPVGPPRLVGRFPASSVYELLVG